MFKGLLSVMFLALLVGCSYNPITKPKPLLLKVELDSGPPEYRAGYKDGCESALAAYGNSYQKSFYRVAKDPKYQSNRMYNQVWKDSWNYCYMWLFTHQQSSPMYGKSLF